MTNGRIKNKAEILVVEDDAIISMFLQKSLLDMGCNVSAALTRGEEALTYLETDRPDLVLSDIVLKGELDGIEMAREIRSRYDIPVVFLTAYADEEKLRRAKLVRPFGYLMKPFQDKDLKVTVEMALYTSRLEADRKKAEAALRERENMFRMVFEKSPTGICVFHKNGEILSCNKQLGEIMGVEHPQSLVGFNFLERMKNGPNKDAIKDAIKSGSASFEGPYISVSGGRATYLKADYKKVADDILLGVYEDLTSQKQSEQALKESERLYRLLFQSGNDAVFIHHLDDDGFPGLFLEVNEIACQRLGYTKEELLTLSPLDIGGPETQPKAPGFGLKLLKTGRAIFETVHRAKDGRLIPVESSVRLFELNGKRMVLSIARDISERKKMEATLRESEERYRRIVDLSPELIAVHQNGEVLFINKSGLRLIGADSSESVIGKSILDFTDWRPGESSTEAMEYFLNNDLPMPEVEANLIHLSGKKIEAEFQTVPFIKDGSPAYQVTARDITQRKRAERTLRETEENFRQLADNIREMFWLRDRADGRMVYVSPAFETIWGRTREEIHNEPDTFFDSVHPEDVNRVRASFQVLEESGQPFIEEYRIVRPDGSIRFVGARSFPIYNENGEIFRFAGIAEDITERKQVEAEKEKMEGLLRQAQKMEAIGTLAGGIAHDFNNILSAILGYTELALLDAPTDTQLQRNLGQVMKAGRRARDLVRQILDFSRRTDQKKMLLELAPLLKEDLKLLRSSLPSTIEIKTRIYQSEPLVIKGDATQVHQILMNLCANAAHAMRRLGGVLEVTLSRADVSGEEAEKIPGLSPGEYAVMEVKDNGEGIHPLIISRIFDPFFTTKGTGEGTGMGLAVVFGIIQNHGGGITVESQPGEGARFKVYLPLAETKPIQEEVVMDSAQPGGSERILFVDDEEQLADLGKEILDHLGYVTAKAESGQDALDIFIKNPYEFDMVITDYTMPHMTGLALAEKILAVRPEIPIILCTGFSQEETQEKAAEIGIKKFLMKPLVINEVAQVIREVLDSAKTG